MEQGGVSVTYKGLCKLKTKTITGTVEGTDATGRVVYAGPCTDNEFNGENVTFFSELGMYTGSMRMGVMNGCGRLECANGNVYEGDWSNDVKQGRGTMRYVDGQSFKGTWKNGQWEDGTLLSADGSSKRVLGGTILSAE